jgi:hypothetical protein
MGAIHQDVPVLSVRPGGRKMLPPDARDLAAHTAATGSDNGVLAAHGDDLTGTVDSRAHGLFTCQSALIAVAGMGIPTPHLLGSPEPGEAQA